MPSPETEEWDESADRPVAAVERALSILDTFLVEGPTLTLAAISKRTNLYKSTILRLINTLVINGYLSRSDSGEFHIGPSVLRLASSFQNAVQPQEVVLPILRKLVEETGETASYIVRQQDFRICLYRVNSPQVLRDHGAPGDVAPLERGAAGRIFMAFANPENPKFADIRKQMIAITYGELHPGMAGIAAPVFGMDGFIAGVIGLTGPETRFGSAATKPMQARLLEAAAMVTARLGGEASIFEIASKRKKKSR